MLRFSRLLVTLLALHGVHAAADVALAEPAGAPVLRAGSGCTYATIQAAVDAVASGGSAIIRVRTGTYSENVQVGNRSIDLIGGHADCVTNSPNGMSTINAGGASLPALRFLVSTGGATRDLFVNRFRLTAGTGNISFLHDFPGGGLSVWALENTTVNVSLDNVLIDFNSSPHTGGGVALVGSGAGSLTFVNNTRIHSNQVTGSTPHGGGLYCNGDYQIIGLGSSIAANTAGTSGGSSGRGGGMYLLNCDLTWFAQGDGSGEGALRHNVSYGRGGGLWAVFANVQMLGSHLTFGSPISTRPMRIYGNVATHTGGGAIFAQAEGTVVRLTNTWVYDNHATSDHSGAFYVWDGAQVIVDRSETCHTPRQCSRIFDNTAPRNVIGYANTNSILQIRRTILSGNQIVGDQSDRGLFAVASGGVIELDDSLLYGNSGERAARLGSGPTPTRLRIRRTTITANSFSNQVLQTSGDESRITIFDSIIHQPGTPMLHIFSGSPILSIDCVLWHSNQLESHGTHTLVADPLFTNPTQGQFYLQPGSPAVNFCMDYGQPADLEFRPRGIPHSGQPPRYGPVDLGAFELPLLLFRDRFQSSP